VFVRLRPQDPEPAAGELALVAELVRRTSESAQLRQFNPDRTFEVDAAEIAAIHKIAGELF
jgi:hypothetical protein